MTLATTGASFDKDLGYLTNVGAYTAATSYYGLSDLDGLVYNWTEASRENRTFAGQYLPIYRGGMWQNNELNSGAAFRNTGNGAGVNSGQFQNWGFRVASLAPVGPTAVIIDVPTGTSQTQGQAGYPSLGTDVATSVTKTGGGTLVLDQLNTYTGTTSIDQGVLAITGTAAIANSLLVSVAPGATFDVSNLAGSYAVPSGQTIAGSGSVLGSLTFGPGSTLSPGALGGASAAAMSAADGQFGTPQAFVVPEPTALGLVGVGLALLGLGILRRKPAV